MTHAFNLVVASAGNDTGGVPSSAGVDKGVPTAMDDKGRQINLGELSVARTVVHNRPNLSTDPRRTEASVVCGGGPLTNRSLVQPFLL